VRRLALALAIASLLGLAVAARAHDPGLSEAELDVGADAVEARWWIDAADLAEAPAAAQALRLELDGAQRAPAQASAHTSWDGHHVVSVRWSGAPRERLSLTAELLASLPLGHRMHLRVWDEFGRLLAEGVLSARSPTLEHPRAEGLAER
jgi:hypothetical protein